MPVPTVITDLDDTAANNFPQDTDLTGGTVASLPRNHSAIIKKQFIKGTDIAVIGNGSQTIPDENSYFVVTGTGFTVSGFADCFNGRIVTLKFSGVLTLTDSATFAMPTSADITTAADDVASFVNESAGTWRCISFDRAVATKAVADAATASESYTDAAIANTIEAGTVMTFFQAAAPTDWTQDASITNHMIRLVGTAGGGTGGSDNPILNDKIPTHNHTASSDDPGNHTHGIWDTAINIATSGGGGHYSHYLTQGTASGAGGGHTHAITVDNNSGSNWAPLYIDMIVASKD